jgi:hypothetical protein
MAAANQSGAAAIDGAATQINSQFNATLTAADATAAQQVQTIGLVHQARLAQLTRTAAAASAKYGGTSTQAVAANAAVTVAQGTVARTAVLSRQVSAPQPDVDATGWALHGYVYNDQLQPVSAYSVFLVDEQNAYQSAYGFAYTDETGYFALNVPGPSGATKGQAQARQAGGAAAAPAPPPKLFVQVANAKAQPVYLSTSAFVPTTGAATFHNIALPAGEKPIGNPPSAIRKTALPPKKKKSS